MGSLERLIVIQPRVVCPAARVRSWAIQVSELSARGGLGIRYRPPASTASHLVLSRLIVPLMTSYDTSNIKIGANGRFRWLRSMVLAHLASCSVTLAVPDVQVAFTGWPMTPGTFPVVEYPIWSPHAQDMPGAHPVNRIAVTSARHHRLIRDSRSSAGRRKGGGRWRRG